MGGNKRVAAQLGMSIDEYMAKCASGEKFCWRCQAWHPRTDFNRDSSRTDGLDTSCRESRNKAMRDSYESTARVSKKGEFFVPTRDGDKQQARARVNQHVRTGLLPDPNDIPCHITILDIAQIIS